MTIKRKVNGMLYKFEVLENNEVITRGDYYVFFGSRINILQMSEEDKIKALDNFFGGPKKWTFSALKESMSVGDLVADHPERIYVRPVK